MRAGARPRGFTLIELTIVLALVALLLTIAVPRYFQTVENGKLSVQRQNVAAIRDAIDKYYGDQGRYPDELGDLVKKRYLRSIPVDPLTDQPNWSVVAPEDTEQGRVYDVRSTRPPAAPADLTRSDTRSADEPAPLVPTGGTGGR